MKIISFDIGIKNMAYCIFSVNATIDNVTNTVQYCPFEINDWNILNLMEQEAPSIYCNQCIILKTAKSTKKNDALTIIPPKICCKVAKFKKGNHIFCDKHAKKQTEWRIPEPKFSQNKIKQMKLEPLLALAVELNIANIPKKRSEIIERIGEIIAQSFMEPVIPKKTQSAGNTDLIVIGKNMKLLLDQVLAVHRDITHILIENQISPIANRMKTVQGMLAQYFIMSYEDPKIEIVSSANKLKGFAAAATATVAVTAAEAPETKTPKENTIDGTEKSQRQKYKEHKKDGVYYSKLILETNPRIAGSQWLSVLDTKKKDDLADCFLQGIWYLTNKKYISMDAQLRIQ